MSQPTPVTGPTRRGSAALTGELLAAHMTGRELPEYSRWFLLERYRDPEYQDLLENWDESGQL